MTANSQAKHTISLKEREARIAAQRKRRQFESRIMQGVMFSALAIIMLALLVVLGVVIVRGLPTITWEMLTQPPKGGSIMSGGKGGISNAILGSLYLAVGATTLAFLFSLPVALYLNAYQERHGFASWVRLALDVLWGVPSLLYGAVMFTIMLTIGLRGSLLAGIITLAIVELPIMARTMDEVLRLVPRDLHYSTLSLGATRWELMGMLARQTIPGLFTATLLAFGRGIGDAAAVLLTAGYTDRLVTGLFDPTASLPLTVFFQLGTPYPAAQARGYAAAFILCVVVLTVNIVARIASTRFATHTVR
jgi:phosphate transport system permease protein